MGKVVVGLLLGMLLVSRVRSDESDAAARKEAVRQALLAAYRGASRIERAYRIQGRGSEGATMAWLEMYREGARHGVAFTDGETRQQILVASDGKLFCMVLDGRLYKCSVTLDELASGTRRVQDALGVLAKAWGVRLDLPWDPGVTFDLRIRVKDEEHLAFEWKLGWANLAEPDWLTEATFRDATLLEEAGPGEVRLRTEIGQLWIDRTDGMVTLINGIHPKVDKAVEVALTAPRRTTEEWRRRVTDIVEGDLALATPWDGLLRSMPLRHGLAFLWYHSPEALSQPKRRAQAVDALLRAYLQDPVARRDLGEGPLARGDLSWRELDNSAAESLPASAPDRAALALRLTTEVRAAAKRILRGP